MANSGPDEARDYNTKIIEEFRANEGRVGGPWAGIPLTLIHHVGAKSGMERVTLLGCFPQPDGWFAIAASRGGSPAHPDWYYSLKAYPRITVEVGTQAFPVLTEELAGAARAALWPTLVAQGPSVGKFQAKITWQIPVFMLTARTDLERQAPDWRLRFGAPDRDLGHLAGPSHTGSSGCTTT